MVARDLRGAYRSLRGSPGFTAVALSILTLGIGASTAIFSVVDAVVLRGLPFDEGDRILQIGHISTVSQLPQTETPQVFLDVQTAQHAFEAVAATAETNLSVPRPDDGQMQTLQATEVMGDLFGVLRAHPAIGRALTSEDDVDGRDRVVVISDALWRRRFGADPAIVGRTLDTSAGGLEIVGVMAPGFAYPVDAVEPTDAWVPHVPTANQRMHGRGRSFTWLIVGRIRRGLTLGQARAEVAADRAGPRSGVSRLVL